MIRRDDGSDWLLISQVDHARLAGEVAAAWGNADVPPLPVAELLVRAIRLHDDGWFGWEAVPTVDPATGRPRDFTEMPMAVATRIWTGSIDTAAEGEYSQAAAVRRYGEWLQLRGESLTVERSAVLAGLLSVPTRMAPRELAVRLHAEGTPVDASDVASILEEFVQAGIAQRRGRLAEDESCEATVPTVGENPLGGLWVSQHFAFLAEQAQESREDAEDRRAAEEFLREQETARATWQGDALDAFAGENVERLVEGGFRLLQFFDRLSLWICCGERTESETLPFPDGTAFRFTPTADGFAIEPWPLETDSLSLALRARRLPRGAFANDHALHDALGRASVERLEWTLARP